MKMEGETTTLRRNLTEWRFSQYPKYILLPIDENNDQVRGNIKNVVFSEIWRTSVRDVVFLEVSLVRKLAIIYLTVSDEAIVRDMYYNGCPRREKAASLLRISPMWFRFGSLEILANNGEIAVLNQLADFIIKVIDLNPRTEEDRSVGFTHGLLNTDNMSILGLTLDYGPFGFVDSYDGGFVANCSDGEGRYALSKQPDVVVWNIGQLANALKPLLTTPQQVHMSHILKTLDTYCKNKILETFLMKIGLKEERWGDEQLVEKLLDMMQQTGADFTCTFRQLAERLSSHSSWGCWLDQYRERLDKEADERRRRMLCVNPVYVPRNWMLHEAIADAENDDFTKVRFLMEVLRNPYQVQSEAERLGFSSQPPQWAYALKISCST
ncbi:Uncharacterized protein OBRU01_04998 [Operophtera brumata]|uniref:Selenoprotein O n=1 Tax=Operophtera brumata TaxID=104452 RepID=A0A0L7LNE1_OPEBR|nr:Uncharacterized protein OBRU01_04998 [Operophtera brumata]